MAVMKHGYERLARECPWVACPSDSVFRAYAHVHAHAYGHPGLHPTVQISCSSSDSFPYGHNRIARSELSALLY